jgi:hypothetical protein
MTKRKALGLDKIMIKFCVKVWHAIGAYYCSIIVRFIKVGRLLKGVTKRLITPLYKFGEKSELGNWHPISLLNMAYKICVKALQLHMQPILMELIDGD